MLVLSLEIKGFRRFCAYFAGISGLNFSAVYADINFCVKPTYWLNYFLPVVCGPEP
jgi:hypothetical protein